MKNIAKMALPVPMDQAFDYLIPQELGSMQKGKTVCVSFGRRKMKGIILEIKDNSDYPIHKLKNIVEKYDTPLLKNSFLEFIQKVAKYNLIPLGDVIKAVLQGESEEIYQEKYYRLKTQKPLIRLTPKRQQVIEALKENISLSSNDLKQIASTSVIKGLSDQNIIEAFFKKLDHGYKIPEFAKTEMSFNDEQKSAIEVVAKDIKKDKGFKTYLLDGVTGSGKTETFLEMVAEVFSKAKQVLILMPEIALTDQSAKRFEKRFGVKPALWHSKSTKKDKELIRQGVIDGSIHCVIGARSSLFLPFSNLGMIIIDEEHDNSYKQEEGMRYNARDMAVLRAKTENIPIILASATPSLESYVNAEMGRYEKLLLRTRFGGANLPNIHLVDMVANPPERGMWISPKLKEAICETYEKNEQTLLFINRRGYAPLMICRSCGYRVECDNCSVWIVYHKQEHKLVCHQCGKTAPVPVKCKSCGATGEFAPCGPGVERLMEEVTTLFPQMKAVIFSSDYQNNPEKLSNILEQIRNKEIDIIIGTQMIAKGHDFKNMTTVGIIDADLGLSGGDLRANEKTFQILEQVSGRAGRHKGKQGNIYIQTYNPLHPVMQAIKNRDRDGLLDIEAENRINLSHPPFGRFAAIILSSQKQKELHDFCKILAQKCPYNDDISIYGPAPAAISMLRGKYRYRFLVKTPKKTSIQSFLKYWLKDVNVPNYIQLNIDIDPITFL